MKRTEELLTIVESMPQYDKEKLDECVAYLVALGNGYGMVATFAMSIHLAIYQDILDKSQTKDMGYFEYLAEKR